MGNGKGCEIKSQSETYGLHDENEGSIAELGVLTKARKNELLGVRWTWKCTSRQPVHFGNEKLTTGFLSVKQ